MHKTFHRSKTHFLEIKIRNGKPIIKITCALNSVCLTIKNWFALLENIKNVPITTSVELENVVNLSEDCVLYYIIRKNVLAISLCCQNSEIIFGQQTLNYILGNCIKINCFLSLVLSDLSYTFI